MDDMILNDEIYDKMQAEYDRQNIPTRAFGGVPPFCLNASAEIETEDFSAAKINQNMVDIYNRIYSIEYEIYSYLSSMPSTSMLGRLICLKKRTLALIEQLLSSEANQAPQTVFLPELEDVDCREGQMCSYMLSCELYDLSPTPSHTLLMSYLTAGLVTLSL
ncbi:MAG: hypothetical protein IKD20_00840 [Clostridia bacterium]|nr:hypothetical protein [Clostridia bacterium]MBR7159561.1 hypothetical protein [Clostridia bacterium]